MKMLLQKISLNVVKLNVKNVVRCDYVPLHPLIDFEL